MQQTVDAHWDRQVWKRGSRSPWDADIGGVETSNREKIRSVIVEIRVFRDVLSASSIIVKT